MNIPNKYRKIKNWNIGGDILTEGRINNNIVTAIEDGCGLLTYTFNKNMGPYLTIDLQDWKIENKNMMKKAVQITK